MWGGLTILRSGCIGWLKPGHNWNAYFQNGNPADVCYELDENHFNGLTSIQMTAIDIKKIENGKLTINN